MQMLEQLERCNPAQRLMLEVLLMALVPEELHFLSQLDQQADQDFHPVLEV
jgi:hypothetical protein